MMMWPVPFIWQAHLLPMMTWMQINVNYSTHHHTWPNQFFSLSDGVHQASVFIHRVQNLLIGSFLSSTHFLILLTFSKSTFQTIPVVECPLSSTSMFLQQSAYNTVLQVKSLYYSFLNSKFIFPLNNYRLLNASFKMAIRRFTSSWHLQSSVIYTF